MKYRTRPHKYKMERELLKTKINEIKRLVDNNSEYIKVQEDDYKRILDNCKNQYELAQAENDTLLFLMEYEQTYLKGALMLIVSTFEFFLKNLYRETLKQNPNKEGNKSIVASMVEYIVKEKCIKLNGATLHTFNSIKEIVLVRNTLVHEDAQLYMKRKNYNVEEHKGKEMNSREQQIIRHLKKHESVKIIDLLKWGNIDRIDFYLSPNYIKFVCNVILYFYYSFTKIIALKSNRK